MRPQLCVVHGQHLRRAADLVRVALYCLAHALMVLRRARLLLQLLLAVSECGAKCLGVSLAGCHGGFQMVHGGAGLEQLGLDNGGRKSWWWW